MYYDFEEEFRKPEPDIDEEIKKLKEREALVEHEFKNSEKTAEDFKKYQYSLLAIAENKNHLLEKKLVKYEIERSDLKSSVNYFYEFCRYSGAERFFLCLLCGFATTIFLPAPDIITFVFQLIGSFILAFLVMLTNVLFPKEKGKYWIGDFYADHPHIYAIIVFIIIATTITIVKFLKQ